MPSSSYDETFTVMHVDGGTVLYKKLRQLQMSADGSFM